MKKQQLMYDNTFCIHTWLLLLCVFVCLCVCVCVCVCCRLSDKSCLCCFFFCAITCSHTMRKGVFGAYFSSKDPASEAMQFDKDPWKSSVFSTISNESVS